MKLRNKLLISLLIFCFVLILSKTTFGVIDTITIKVGESYDISASSAIAGAKNIGACSVKEGTEVVSAKAKDVVGVDYVTVKGLKKGTAKIEFNVKSDGEWKTCAYNIVVEAREKVNKTLTIEVGEMKIITASEAVYGEVNIMAVSNENEDFISVNKDDSTNPDQLKIKGLKKGTATLKFNVGPDDDDYTNCVYTIVVKEKTEKNYNITMKVGETKKITASQAVSGQENIMAANSDDPTTVKVTKTEITGEDYLTLEALKEGTTKVRLNVGKNDKDYKNCVYTITVEPKDKVTKTITMRVGETKIITASMAVTGKENIAKYSNENEDIISINKDDYTKPDKLKIEALKEGTATLKFNVEIDGGNYVNCVYTIVVTLTGAPSEVIGDRDQSTFVDVLDNIDGYSKPGDLDDATSQKIESAASIILSAITSIGVVIAIVILAVLGVKYMLGSVEEKAEYKKDLVPYLIGACLLFGISTFVKIFMQWGQTISNL